MKLCLSPFADGGDPGRQRDAGHHSQYIDRQAADIEARNKRHCFHKMAEECGDWSAGDGIGEPGVARKAGRLERAAAIGEIMRNGVGFAVHHASLSMAWIMHNIFDVVI